MADSRGFADLPDEVVAEIFGYLGGSDLHSAMQVCKRLNPIAQQAIWYGAITPVRLQIQTRFLQMFLNENLSLERLKPYLPDDWLARLENISRLSDAPLNLRMMALTVLAREAIQNPSFNLSLAAILQDLTILGHSDPIFLARLLNMIVPLTAVEPIPLLGEAITTLVNNIKSRSNDVRIAAANTCVLLAPFLSESARLDAAQKFISNLTFPSASDEQKRIYAQALTALWLSLSNKNQDEILTKMQGSAADYLILTIVSSSLSATQCARFLPSAMSALSMRDSDLKENALHFLVARWKEIQLKQKPLILAALYNRLDESDNRWARIDAINLLSQLSVIDKAIDPKFFERIKKLFIHSGDEEVRKAVIAAFINVWPILSVGEQSTALATLNYCISTATGSNQTRFDALQIAIEVAPSIITRGMVHNLLVKNFSGDLSEVIFHVLTAAWKKVSAEEQQLLFEFLLLRLQGGVDTRVGRPLIKACIDLWAQFSLDQKNQVFPLLLRLLENQYLQMFTAKNLSLIASQLSVEQKVELYQRLLPILTRNAEAMGLPIMHLQQQLIESIQRAASIPLPSLQGVSTLHRPAQERPDSAPESPRSPGPKLGGTGSS